MRPDFLFAQPSMLSGAARTLDLMGEIDAYNDSPSEELADRRALFADWRTVGETLLGALRTLAREQASKPQR